MNTLLNRLAFALMFATTLTTSCARATQYPSHPSELIQSIVSVLPVRWYCVADESHIVLSYSSKVCFLNGISLPGTMSHGELIKELGSWDRYMLVLRFVPKYTDAEFTAMKKTRSDATQAADTNGKFTYGDVIAAAHRFPIPKYYYKTYSIYLERSDEDPLEVASPLSFVADLRKLLQMFESTFTLYDTKSKPSAGLYSPSPKEAGR